MAHSLKYYANLSQEILKNNTEYSKNKKLISNLFEEDNNLTLEKIQLRITIIDATYSTNMNRRLFGIADLSKKILEISSNKDKILKSKIEQFINNTNNETLDNVFSSDFGINKNGLPGGKATSLISKYFYFIMNYKFPIYDSLVKDSLPDINKRYKIINNIQLNNIEIKIFLLKIKEFNQKSGIDNFDILDNMCWLYGKIQKGSLSLILSKENYQKLINPINLTNLKSSAIDNAISIYIKDNINNINIFTKNEIEFIQWVYDTTSSK